MFARAAERNLTIIVDNYKTVTIVVKDTSTGISN